MLCESTQLLGFLTVLDFPTTTTIGSCPTSVHRRNGLILLDPGDEKIQVGRKSGCGNSATPDPIARFSEHAQRHLAHGVCWRGTLLVLLLLDCKIAECAAQFDTR